MTRLLCRLAVLSIAMGGVFIWLAAEWQRLSDDAEKRWRVVRRRWRSRFMNIYHARKDK